MKANALRARSGPSCASPRPEKPGPASEPDLKNHRWRIVARSTEQLGRILEVSPRAITNMEAARRIPRELDGTWSVLDVVNAWRRGIESSLQRDPSPWLDPRVALNVTMLSRRARYAGARVEYRAEGDTAWHAIPDPVQRVNRGPRLDDDNSLADYLAVMELNELAPGARYWLYVPEMTAPIAAKITGASEAKAREAIEAVVGVALLWKIALEERDALGPATANQTRHGRIPLERLCPGETNRCEQPSSLIREALAKLENGD
jgi:hypothetical protein